MDIPLRTIYHYPYKSPCLEKKLQVFCIRSGHVAAAGIGAVPWRSGKSSLRPASETCKNSSTFWNVYTRYLIIYVGYIYIYIHSSNVYVIIYIYITLYIYMYNMYIYIYTYLFTYIYGIWICMVYVWYMCIRLLKSSSLQNTAVGRQETLWVLEAPWLAGGPGRVAVARWFHGRFVGDFMGWIDDMIPSGYLT